MVCETDVSVGVLVLDSHNKAAGLDERVVAVDCVELEKNLKLSFDSTLKTLMLCWLLAEEKKNDYLRENLEFSFW